MTPAYYRGEAKRCRMLADERPNSLASKQLLTLAAEYDVLAEEIEKSSSDAASGTSKQGAPDR
jgi:hypothetical protein